MKHYVIPFASLVVAIGAFAQSFTVVESLQYMNGVDSGSKIFSQTMFPGLPQRLEGVLNVTTNWQSISTGILTTQPSYVILKMLSTNFPGTALFSGTNSTNFAFVGLTGTNGGDMALFRLNGTNFWYETTTNSMSVYYAIFAN